MQSNTPCFATAIFGCCPSLKTHPVIFIDSERKICFPGKEATSTAHLGCHHVSSLPNTISSWGIHCCPMFFWFFLGGKTYPEIHHLSQLSRWLKNLTEEFSKYESNYYQQFLYAKFISISNYQLSRQNLWWAAECQSTRSPSPVNHLTVQYNKIRLEWHLW